MPRRRSVCGKCKAKHIKCSRTRMQTGQLCAQCTHLNADCRIAVGALAPDVRMTNCRLAGVSFLIARLGHEILACPWHARTVVGREGVLWTALLRTRALAGWAA
eukprot:1950787-Pleurochrysis_carterae.AAC.3